MLVLSRKATQQIQIGDNIVVTIVQVKGHGVKIGIEAPDNVRIVRSEIAGEANQPVAGEASPAKEAGDPRRPPRKPRSDMTPTRAHREASTDDCFSPPVFSIDEPDATTPIGESSGLFPRLRERASRTPPCGYYPAPVRVMTNPSCSIIR